MKNSTAIIICILIFIMTILLLLGGFAKINKNIDERFNKLEERIFAEVNTETTEVVEESEDIKEEIETEENEQEEQDVEEEEETVRKEIIVPSNWNEIQNEADNLLKCPAAFAGASSRTIAVKNEAYVCEYVGNGADRLTVFAKGDFKRSYVQGQDIHIKFENYLNINEKSTYIVYEAQNENYELKVFSKELTLKGMDNKEITVNGVKQIEITKSGKLKIWLEEPIDLSTDEELKNIHFYDIDTEKEYLWKDGNYK